MPILAILPIVIPSIRKLSPRTSLVKARNYWRKRRERGNSHLILCRRPNWLELSIKCAHQVSVERFLAGSSVGSQLKGIKAKKDNNRFEIVQEAASIEKMSQLSTSTRTHSSMPSLSNLSLRARGQANCSIPSKIKCLQTSRQVKHLSLLGARIAN